MVACMASNPAVQIVMCRFLNQCINVKTQHVNSAKAGKKSMVL